ncbi:MAG: hypothetical protein N2C12_05450, partial [Planctomycetales bacterium]
YVLKFASSAERNTFLEDEYMFVGATYWRALPHSLPGLFSNPISGDRVNFAQLLMFIPRNRLHWEDGYSEPQRQRHSTEWSLLNQNWRVKLVPGTMPRLSEILQTNPDLVNQFGGSIAAEEITLPQLDGMQAEDISVINHH